MAPPPSLIPGAYPPFVSIRENMQEDRKATFLPTSRERGSDIMVALIRGGRPVRAKIDGVLRGLIRKGASVREGLRVGDIDPRGRKESCYSISGKALADEGAVSEGILRHYFSFFLNYFTKLFPCLITFPSNHILFHSRFHPEKSRTRFNHALPEKEGDTDA